MSVYKQVAIYAKLTQTTTAQATVRCAYFNHLEEKKDEAKKCPKCGEKSLVFDQQVYCENEVVPAMEDGYRVYEDCGFERPQNEEERRLFGTDIHDEVWERAQQFRTHGFQEEEVYRALGMTWEVYVEKANDRLSAEPLTS